MFHIQYENDADNTLMVWLLVRVLTLSQGLFSGSCSASEEVHKEEERSTARTGDLKWSKGCSTK